MQIPGMDQETLVVVAVIAAVVIVLLIVVAIVMSMRRRKQRDELRDRFGPEYDHAVRSEGSKAAVADLHGRVEDRESFSPADPGEETREALRRRMAMLQYRFVEDPADALLETQRTVTDALRACGYPVAEDRGRTLKLLSVDYPEVTPSLRTLLEGSYGHDVARMQSLFLDAKRALREIARVGYGPDDLTTTGAVTAEERPARAGDPAERPPPSERAASEREAPAEPAARSERAAPADRRSVIAPDEPASAERTAAEPAGDDGRERPVSSPPSGVRDGG